MVNTADLPETRVRVHRGIVLRAGASTDVDLHVRQLHAVAGTLSPGAAFCFESAAAVHGLPMWAPHLDLAHVMLPGNAHGNRTRWVHRYRAPQRPPRTVMVNGLCVTSLAQTASDLMRRYRFGPALAVADAALRLGVPRPVLEGLSDGGRGCRLASEAARRADPRSESPYESMARALMLQHDLPMPLLQHEFFDGVLFVARSDFFWPAHRLVAEFDGEVKYSTLLRPGETRDDVVAAQALRQARLESLGYRVIRWTSADVDAVPAFVEGLSRDLGHRRVDHALCPEARDYRRLREDRPRRRRMPWA
jgi:very-short-patch-repair endonuclease